MVEVQNNRYYKRQVITEGVSLYPRFKDFSNKVDDIFYLNGGYNATQIVLSGSVPLDPTVGGGELESAYLQTYCTGMSLSGAVSLPEIEVYVAQPNIDVKEGGFTVGTYVNGSNVIQTGIDKELGDKLAVYSAYLDPEIPWMIENFDGSNKSFGTALLQDNDRAASSIKDLFISAEDGEDIIWAGGDAFFGGGASDNISHNLEKYFSNKDQNNRVYVRPLKKNNIKGLWTATYDNRNEKQKWQIYQPYWKWKQLSSKVQVGTPPVPAQGANTKEVPEVSVNNTIFNDIYSSASLGNVLTVDGKDKPMFHSSIEINGEKKASGGSALKAHHMITYTTSQKFMSNMEAAYLGKHKYNNQTIKLGMWNIPKPVPLDTGGFGYAPFSGSSVLSGSISGSAVSANTEIAFGAHVADKRMSLPEINMTFNIAKMLPSPAINNQRYNGTNTNNTIYYRNTNVATSSSPNVVDSTDGEASVDAADVTFKNSRGGLRTFWRSMVVTWSSYKADGFNNLDDFLHYGMNRFYIDGKNDVQLCGMVFQRMHADAEYNLSGALTAPDPQDANIGNLYAYALPVTQWGNPTTNDVGLYAKGGMASFLSGNKGRVMVHDPRILTETNVVNEPHWVELPPDGWVTMKTMFNISTPWGKKTYSKDTSPYDMTSTYNPAGLASGSATAEWPRGNQLAYGTPAMVFFDGAVSGSNSGSDQIEPAQNMDENKPFVVMPYMVRNDERFTGSETQYDGLDGVQCMLDGPTWEATCGTGSTKTYRGISAAWKQSPWTPHMTIWINNYRWTAYNSTSSSPDYVFQGVTGSIGGTYGFVDYRGADSRLYESGSAIPEALVYIDDIEFKYFNNTIINHSATAGKIQQFINFKNPTIKTPLITRYSGATGQPQDAVMLRDLNRDGTLYPRRTGHGLALGFDKYEQLVNVVGEHGIYDQQSTAATSFKYGYALLNNFSTQSFDNLTAVAPAAAWLTVAPNIITGDSQQEHGSGLGFWDHGGYQCFGTAWGNNLCSTAGTPVKLNVSAAPNPSDPTSYNSTGSWGSSDAQYMTSATSQQCGWYTTAWQGLGHWNGGASGTTYAKGGEDFHGGDKDSPYNFLSSKSYTTGRAWVNVSEEGQPYNAQYIYTPPGASDYNTPSWPHGRAYAGHSLAFGSGNSSTSESFGSTDGLRQKGFMGIAVDFTQGTTIDNGSSFTVTTDDNKYLWHKRENIWASAKILAVPGHAGLNMADDEATLDDNAIIVDDAGILLPDQEDCEYVIYRVGAGIDREAPRDIYSGTTWDGTYDGTSATFIKIAKLSMSKANAQGTEGVIYLDQPMTNLSSWPLSELWISPYKYWINMSLVSTDNGEYTPTTGFNKVGDTVAPLNFTRSYESIMLVNERLMTGSGVSIEDLAGSTYNESTYTYDATQGTGGLKALITRPWILEAGSEQTSLIVDKDFGFGAYDKEENEGGQLGKTAVVNSTFNDIELKGLVSELNVAPEENVNLVLGLSNQVANKTVSLIGDENTGGLDEAFLPTMIWQYRDELPNISKFSVSPAFDALSKDVNLYDLTKENVNDIKFDWEESGDDVWYRMLMIDTKNIPDKYANAKFWAPLNVSSSTIGSAPALKEYDMTVTPRQYPNGGTALTVGTSVRTKIDGLSGYAAYTASSSTGMITGTNQMDAMTDFTFCGHYIPSSNDGGTNVWLVAQGDPTSTGFGIKLHNGNVVAYLHGDAITSTSLIPCDNQTPLSVIVTYEKDSKIGPDLRLYVNGAMEDYKLASDPCASSAANLLLGGSGSSGTYRGSMEEIVIYNKAIPIIESDSEYLYNPSELTEVSGDDFITHHSRLFIMDYHNIRGLNRKQVASSNQVSWKVTTL